jgi:hypothetical protein
MKTISILILLFAAGCGTPDGLEIDTNQYDIATSDVTDILYLTEQEFIEMYPKFANFDIDRCINNHGLSIEFKDEDTRSQTDKNRKVAGYFYPSTNEIIIFMWQTETPRRECTAWRNRLGHEVLHFIADNYIHWDGKPHMYPNMFAKWSDRTGQPYNTTVEWHIETEIYQNCKHQDIPVVVSNPE